MRAMDRGGRLAGVRQAISESGCEALVVTKLVNLRWLSGFTGSSGVGVVTPTDFTVITDGRYRQQLHDELERAGVEARQVIERDISEPLKAAVGDAGSIGLEADDVSWSQQQELTTVLSPAALVPTVGLVAGLRRIKDDGEIDRLSAAAAIADEALARTVDELGLSDTTWSPGPTAPSEKDVAARLEAAMFELGADGLSFDTIVASGPNSALPHARPSARKLESGDLVVIDFGASLDGYGSDMTRTFRLGPVPRQADELYEAVACAQAAGLATAAAGVAERDVDASCRNVLDQFGLGEAFIHGTGHGIGLEIHEEPIMSTRSTGILRTNQVITIEPGAYLPGFGGVRIEDSVVVTATECHPITRHPKPVVESR